MAVKTAVLPVSAAFLHSRNQRSDSDPSHPAGVASHLCSGANMIVSKLGALIVLDAILGRPIDVDSIPMQELAKGVTPGGPGSTLDLAAAGVRPELIKAVQERARVGPQTRLHDLEEEEEMAEEELLERERVLAELMSGGGGGDTDPTIAGFDNARGEAPTEERETRGADEGVFRLADTGGFIRGV